jgi:hypothetical protein
VLSPSAIVDEPTEIVPNVEAGVAPQAEIESFPAAAITTMPLFINSVILLSTEVT